MALNDDQKKGGLFAGLANLSTDNTTSEKSEVDSAKEKGKSSPKNTAASKPSPSAKAVETPIREGLESTEPTAVFPDPPNPAFVPSSDNNAYASPAAPVAHPVMEQPMPNTFQQIPGYQSGPNDPVLQGYAQMSGTRPPTQLIDGRYRRNPKTFRTCIALTEELHQNIERAKMSGRINSLNDLINNLLTDYFKLN